MIDIERESAAPANVAKELSAVIFINNHPIGMLFENLGAHLSAERSKPDACKVAFFVDFIGNVFHAVGELFLARNFGSLKIYILTLFTSPVQQQRTYHTPI